jgi:hypothetical protein
MLWTGHRSLDLRRYVAFFKSTLVSHNFIAFEVFRLTQGAWP